MIYVQDGGVMRHDSLLFEIPRCFGKWMGLSTSEQIELGRTANYIAYNLEISRHR